MTAVAASRTAFMSKSGRSSVWAIPTTTVIPGAMVWMDDSHWVH